jgi:manganese/zinc/iron transport system permease protein
MSIFFDIFSDYTLRNIALGAAILGVVGGVLGAFATLRRQSLVGDVLAHAALPGVCLAFLLTGSKQPVFLLLGAGISGWVAALVLLAVLRSTHLSEDTALGVILSGFFGFGITLLTFIQNGDNANQAGLDKFIFGQAATIIQDDVILMAIIGIIALFFIVLLYKEFKLLSFDPDFLSSLGYPTTTLGTLLTGLIVLAVLIGLQTVGAVLMAAMLVAPATAARQWTDRLASMVVLSGFFGVLSGVLGAVLSSTTQNLPTGPLIILTMSGILIFSLMFAPLRGIVWDAWRSSRNRSQVRLDQLLLDMHVLHNHSPKFRPEDLAQLRHESRQRTQQALRELAEQGWLRQCGEFWELTDSGDAHAHEMLKSMRRGHQPEGQNREELV